MGGAPIETSDDRWSGMESSPSSIQSTLWSVILRARNPKDPHRISALLQLCSQYSMALYAYVRGKGVSPGDSRDAVQGFFIHVREGKLTNGSGPIWERLRSFLLRAFEEYLDQRLSRILELKPGYLPATHLADFSSAEAWFLSDPSREEDLEKTFNRAWARAILLQAHAELKRELAASHGALTADLIAAEVSPVERLPFNNQLATRLDVTVAEVLQILRDSRRRLRELIQLTIRETVSASTDVEVEFWDLFRSV
jgi:hypothetical protein